MGWHYIMKYVIFGAGARGKLIMHFLGQNNVVAFVDNEETFWGKNYDGIPIISFAEYKKLYSDYFIIVTPIFYNGIIEQLKFNNMNNFFNLKDCPDGFYDYSYDLMMNHVLNLLKSNDKINLYGLNLFSILIYDYLANLGYNNVNIILNSKDELSNSLLKILNINYNITECKNVSTDDSLCLTYPIDEGSIKFLKCKYKTLIELYNFSDINNDTNNEQIRQFKNKHVGQRCFVVATGPSLNLEDLLTLKEHNELTISMNSIYKGFENTDWRPKYYVATDPKTDYLMKSIDNMNVDYKFIADRAENFWKHEHADNVFKIHIKYIEGGRDLPFSEDLVKCFYSAGNVTYNCLQLAVYLGCKDIYLLGVDFSNIQYAKGKQTHFVKDYSDDIDVHNGRYVGEGIVTDDEAVQWQGRTYEAAKKYADSHGIKIYNATRGGKLEVFERVDFDSLF